MKTLSHPLQTLPQLCPLAALLWLAPPATQAQDFTYTTNNGTLTVSKYTGPGGAVTIPSAVDGLPITGVGDFAFSQCYSLTSITIPTNVTSLGSYAFSYCSGLTSVTIPASVTNIGDGPFAACSGLSAIIVDASNPAYRSVDGVLSDKLQTVLLQYPAARVGAYSIPGSVTALGAAAFGGCTDLTGITIPKAVTAVPNWAFDGCVSLSRVPLPDSLTYIGYAAFRFCYSLTNMTIPSSVSMIGDTAFTGCSSLTAVYFTGKAPQVYSYLFDLVASTIVYYLPGATGWGEALGGRPAVLWNPQVQPGDPTFGVRANCFGFTITGNTNIPILVEASAAPAGAPWFPLQSCTLTNGSLYVADPQWTNHPARFYRIRSP